MPERTIYRKRVSAVVFLFLIVGFCLICSRDDQPDIATNPSEPAQGLDTLRTINSLEKVADNLYTIAFHGDYTDIMATVNDRFLGPVLVHDTDRRKPGYSCSLFSVFGDPGTRLFGRSFDNPAGWRCLTLVVRCDPPDGHASVSLVRMRDFGFELGVDFDDLAFIDKIALLEAAYHPPDGINEYGVVAGLASVPVVNFRPDPEKKSIWITVLVREILDHARNVDEAAAIAGQYNICCPTAGSLGVHVLVADPSGRSIILEMFDDEIRVIENNEPWQVLTNSPVYNLSIEQQRAACWRFDWIYDFLQSENGSVEQSACMDVLNRVGNTWSQWSAVYDMSFSALHLVLDYHFDYVYHYSVSR
jgi:hypothetical protein